jgi:hypothetical protein
LENHGVSNNYEIDVFMVPVVALLSDYNSFQGAFEFANDNINAKNSDDDFYTSYDYNYGSNSNSMQNDEPYIYDYYD